MKLSNEQINGINFIKNVYNSKRRNYVVISGPPGSGKSSMIKEAIKKLGVPQNEVAYTAYTGKACTVLSKYGNSNVLTLHKLLYKNVQRPDGTFKHIPKEALGYSIICCDEVSMVPKSMLEVMFNYNVFWIFLGDNNQLPPVRSNESNSLLDTPDIELTQIFRQDGDSDILDIAETIRNGKPLQRYIGKDVQVLEKNELNTGMLLWADVILCSTNKTRERINKQIRELLGYTDILEEGEKLICLKNNWDILDNENNALTNGIVGYAKSIYENDMILPSNIAKNLKYYGLIFETDYDTHFIVKADKKMIECEIPTLTPEETYKIRKNKKFNKQLPDMFTYGYCITTHKAQGGQWEKVLVIEEAFPYEDDMHRKLLYTAITRATSKLVIIKK